MPELVKSMIELNIEIEMHSLALDKAYISRQYYERMNSENLMTLDRAVGYINKYQKEINIETETLKTLDGIKEAYKKMASMLEDIEAKVFVKRYFEGKKLIDIAAELSYSEQYIKNIHGKIKRKYYDVTLQSEKEII